MATKAQIFETLLTGQRASGVTLSGGKVYFYEPGTETYKTIYADRGKVTPAANPYTLSANGTAMVYGDGLYDIKLTTAAGVQVALWEDVSLVDSAGQTDSLSNYASLAAAVAAIGSTKTTLQIPSDTTVSADLTVPATLELKIVNEAIVTVASGKTLTINSSFTNGLVQCFAGTGSVMLNTVDLVYAEWFGAKADGATDCATAIHTAMNSVPTGTLKLVEGTYILGTINAGTGNDSAYIVPKSGVSVVGQGDSSIIKVKAGEQAKRWNMMKTTGKLENCVFRDFKMDGDGYNNLLTTPTVNTHGFIIAAGGGKNIEIANVTFTGNPGNNTVAFSTTADCGDIRIHDCRFTEAGTGITGNYSTDHTDIYLLGSRNKLWNNYHHSTNPVNGAAWEFHGADGEAWNNVVDGYYTGCWTTNEEQASGTTIIRNNRFLNHGYSVVAIASVANTFMHGHVIARDNIIEYGDYADQTCYAFGGTAEATTSMEKLEVVGNTVTNYGTRTPFAVYPAWVKNIIVESNVFSGFITNVILIAATLPSDTYTNHSVLIENNLFDNMKGIGVQVNDACKIKTLDISNNTFRTATADIGAAINSSYVIIDEGTIEGNIIDPLFAYDISLSGPSTPTPGTGNETLMVKHHLQSIGGIPGTCYCKAGSVLTGGYSPVYPNDTIWTKLSGSVRHFHKEYRASGAPTIGRFAVGDRVINSVPASGQPKAWVCTRNGENFAGQWAGSTGAITINTKTLTVVSASGLTVGSYITIAGVTGVKEVMVIASNTITIDTNADATVGPAAAVAIAAITFASEGNL